MEKKSRRKFTADFKAKVVIESLKEKNTIEEIARKYELHPNQIALWKKEFLSKAANVFDSEEDHSADKKQQEALLDKLYNQIGKQNVEIEWLKKKYYKND
jgi:transposase-like protein